MLHEDWDERYEEINRESHERRCVSISGSISGSRRFGLAHAQQLLLTPALRESLEVATNGASHLVELTLLAHGRTFPADCWSPAR